MAQYGLGNFLYEFTVDGDKANFKFWDQDDVKNNAEVSLSNSEFPEGVKDADSRQVADAAFAKFADKLNAARDERLKQEAADALAEKTAADAKTRSDAAEFLDTSSDATVAPVKEEKDKDGNVISRVFNTGEGHNQETKKK